MKIVHILQAPLKDVFPYLAHPDLFASVHPVISKIENKGHGQFVIHETLKLGPFTFPFTYPAIIQGDVEKSEVHMQAIVFKMTTMHISFQLTEENGLTTIEEDIEVESKLPLSSLTLNFVKSQHIELFKNIARTIAEST